ncbi:TPA: hypothetical protein I7730_00390 [Vibrio vulnificus]|uniref:Uncharacterized protein n=1 Tax=Vibrio vulnificus TaxID=672 RepID=A0A8H9MVC8_VIBVL|nr:hypothetical protein [Vibrio vulnificus]
MNNNFQIARITKEDKGKTFLGRLMLDYGRRRGDCKALKQYHILRINQKTATVIVDNKEEIKISLDMSSIDRRRHEVWANERDYELDRLLDAIVDKINNRHTKLTREQVETIGKLLNLGI